jgi:hypothetical protein
MVDILRRATESPEPYVIAALAQRWSGRFSHSAANAVAQLKSKCALNAFNRDERRIIGASPEKKFGQHVSQKLRRDDPWLF